VTCHPLADVYRALKKRMPAPARGNGGSAGAPDSGGSKGGSAPTELRMSPPCGEPLDYNLVGDLLRHIVQVEGPAASGSILIFLPGFAEIDRIIRLIRGDPVLNRACKAMPLHSSLSSAEQRAIFRKYPGQRKVIASTNIAETSITIEDCTHVIDSGRVKEVRYDTVSRHSCLLEVWTSRASTKQRAGRSGRVQAGNCWQLFSMEMQESCMPHYTLPELLRMPLEELVLQALVMEVGDPSEFLGRAVQPPPPAMLGLAVQNLIELQAVKREEDEEDDDEQAKGSLTLLPLGFHLAHLPMDARIGKILIMGSIFGCLDPVLTIAATLASKHPFVRPYNDSGAADSARMAFAQHKSDHLASLEAYSAWQSASGRSYGEVKQWCRQHYLSLTGLETIQGLRRQFLDRLRDAGFAQVDGSGVLHAQHNAHASNPRLIACVLCSGLLPQVAYFVRQRPSHFVTRDDVEPVHMHPGSVNFSRFRAAAQTGSTPFVCYYTKAKTSRVYLMDSTVITPFSILLWGGNIRHLRRAASTSRAPETRVKRGCVVAEVDRWLKFSTEEAVAVLFKHLRREVSAILVNKMLAPGASVTNAVMGDTVVKLLQLEGAGV
jgi:ATP-dependent RNA helicase DHX36